MKLRKDSIEIILPFSPHFKNGRPDPVSAAFPFSFLHLVRPRLSLARGNSNFIVFKRNAHFYNTILRLIWNSVGTGNALLLFKFQSSCFTPVGLLKSPVGVEETFQSFFFLFCGPVKEKIKIFSKSLTLPLPPHPHPRLFSCSFLWTICRSYCFLRPPPPAQARGLASQSTENFRD